MSDFSCGDINIANSNKMCQGSAFFTAYDSYLRDCLKSKEGEGLRPRTQFQAGLGYIGDRDRPEKGTLEGRSPSKVPFSDGFSKGERMHIYLWFLIQAVASVGSIQVWVRCLQH